MSRLSVLSWVTSATVHAGVLVLLGAVLTSVPVQQAEIAGSRVVVSSSFTMPAAQATPVEHVEVTPPDEARPVADPALANTAVLASGVEVEELITEPPEPPPPEPKTLDIAELPSLPDVPRIPVQRKRLPRTRPAEFAELTPPVRNPVASPSPEFRDPAPRKIVERLPEPQVVPQPPPVELPPIQQASSAPPLEPVADVQPPMPKASPQTVGTTETKPAWPLSNPNPVYPPDAVRRKLEGVVMLRVTIAASGRVTTVTIAKSSGHGQLDDAARVAVQKWKFAPASRDGQPVEWTARLPVRFRL